MSRIAAAEDHAGLKKSLTSDRTVTGKSSRLSISVRRPSGAKMKVDLLDGAAETPVEPGPHAMDIPSPNRSETFPPVAGAGQARDCGFKREKTLWPTTELGS
jgi:hypothetical protein